MLALIRATNLALYWISPFNCLGRSSLGFAAADEAAAAATTTTTSHDAEDGRRADILRSLINSSCSAGFFNLIGPVYCEQLRLLPTSSGQRDQPGARRAWLLCWPTDWGRRMPSGEPAQLGRI